MTRIPKIISVDDHVVEPPHLWQRWLPAALRDRGPRVVRDSVDADPDDHWNDAATFRSALTLIAHIKSRNLRLNRDRPAAPVP